MAIEIQSKPTPIARFRKLLKVDQKDITQVYIYALFNGLVNLSLPIGIQAIINLIQGGEVSTAWIVLVSFVIAGIALTGVLQLLQLRIVENIAQKIFSRASFEFAYRIPRIKHKVLYNYYAPELANRFFDTLTIQKGLPKILIEFSLALFQIVVGLILLSLYHPFFILFSFGLIALVYIIIAVTGPSGMHTSMQESKYKYKIAFWLEEVARAKLSFKLISGSDLELSKSNERVDKYLQARENHFKVLVKQFLYLIGFKVLIAAGLLISGGILVFNQQMNIGQFVAAEIIIILIIASVEKLIKSLDSIYDVLTALEKIGDVTDMDLENKDGLSFADDTKTFAVSATGLCYKYPDAKDDVIHDLSFQIDAGVSTIVDGAAGHGKSTLMQLLAGILEPTGGIIKFNNFPMDSLNAVKLRSKIGFALSNNELFQGTIMQNIRMGRSEIEAQDIGNAMKLVNLFDFISTLPQGLNTEIDPDGKRIPRSIRNKIILARAIVNKPILLVLEDPLDHISRDEKEEIIKRLVDCAQPWSVIVTSVDSLWSKYIKNLISLKKD